MTYTIRLLTLATIGLTLVLAGSPAPAAAHEVAIEFGKFGTGKGKPKAAPGRNKVKKCNPAKCIALNKPGQIIDEYTIKVLLFKTDNPSCVFTYTIAGVMYEFWYSC